jgi:hypothetical protein
MMTTESTPGALGSNDQLGPLVPCPLCDSRSGYALKDGSTYRWWDVFCVHCGRTVGECASDRRTQLGTELPDRWPAADAVWNEAGAHAQSLRDMLSQATVALLWPGKPAQELIDRLNAAIDGPNVGAKRAP